MPGSAGRFLNRTFQKAVSKRRYGPSGTGFGRRRTHAQRGILQRRVALGEQSGADFLTNAVDTR